MNHSPKPIVRRVAVALLVSTLAGCAVVPYGPPGYYGYGYPEPVYGPVVPVPVPVPFFWPRHHGYRR